ncbi:phosphotransferase [Amycolatopsis sp. NPDC004079]|uniref:phosphotransferase enzyme family protein n=1 Tax=Amycolatopsis sp. NPDC004079 TaxID=3154549 RepID=UPI0033A26A66
MFDDKAFPLVRREPVAVSLGRVFGGGVVPLGDAADFHNIHFRAVAPSSGPVFVKVFDDKDYWGRSLAAAERVESLVRTPRLLDFGPLGPGRWWISYEWLDLEPFAPTAENLRRAGAMLGRLHAATVGDTAGFAEHNLDAEIGRRADDLDAFDPAAADRIRALHARIGPADLPGTPVLIHGDFHARNLALDGDVPVLLDLENMQAASAIVDFGKLVDLDGLPDEALQDTFFAGYEQHAPPVFPWPAAMATVRLWTVCGVLAYSCAAGLTGFAAHGYRRLAELETLGN